MTYGPTLNRVCLPTLFGSLKTHEGSDGIVSGWGLLRDSGGLGGKTSTDVIQKAYLPIISNSECKRIGKYSLFRKWEKPLSK